MIVSSNNDLTTIEKASEISTKILFDLKDYLKPGIYPIELNNHVFNLCKKNKVKPAFYGVKQSSSKPFKFNICISVNEEILHGVPSSSRKLQVGDIVKLDFGIIFQGFYTDHCFTFVIKEFLNEDDKNLVLSAKKSVENAVEISKSETKIKEITEHLSKVNDLFTDNNSKIKLTTLKDFVGHGIGRSLHDLPSIPAYPHKIKNVNDYSLSLNEVICIESQVVQNTNEYFIDNKDSWTVKSIHPKNRSAMFEFMVLVKEGGNKILTPMSDWDIVI